MESTGHLSWTASGQVVLPNPDPNSVFNLYFKGSLPTTTTGTGGAGGRSGSGGAGGAPVDNTNAIQKSILDYVIADLNRFSNIVGTEDKQSIDAAPDVDPRDREAAADDHDDAAHRRRRRRAHLHDDG